MYAASDSPRPRCTICYENLLYDTYSIYTCAHSFHRPCIYRWVREYLRSCPVCRRPIDDDVLQDLEDLEEEHERAGGEQPIQIQAIWSGEEQGTPTQISEEQHRSPASIQISEEQRPWPGDVNEQRRPSPAPTELFIIDSEDSLPPLPLHLQMPTYDAGPSQHSSTPLETDEPVPGPSRYSPTPTETFPGHSRHSPTHTETFPGPSRYSPTPTETGEEDELPGPSQRDTWETIYSQLLSGSIPNEYVSSSSEEDENRDELSPSYFQSTLNFLKKLNLCEGEYNEIVNFKNLHGKFALCDRVIRMKLFFILNDHFKFTSVKDLLHTCRNEKSAAKDFHRIVKDYKDCNVPSARNRILADKGTPYDFFDLPKPVPRNTHAKNFENKFHQIVLKKYKLNLLELRKIKRDNKLLRFYRNRSHNMHDIFKYAGLRNEERSIKDQLQKMEHGNSLCKRRRL